MARPLTASRDRLAGGLGVLGVFVMVAGMFVAVANLPAGVSIVAAGVVLGVGGWAVSEL